MVRHREVEAEQLQDGADQPLGLAQPQAENRTECQGSGNRQAGVAGLTAPTGTWLRLPGLYRLGRKPHRQTAPGTQARIVRCPVRDPVALLGNAVPAGGIGLEQHGGRPPCDRGRAPASAYPKAPDRATDATRWLTAALCLQLRAGACVLPILFDLFLKFPFRRFRTS